MSAPASANQKPTVNFTENELKAFLSTRRIVIADASTNSGRSLRKILMQFGAKSEAIMVCETYEDAKKELQAKPTHILITDIKIGTDSGIDLVPFQEEKFFNRLELATIVMSADTTSLGIGTMVESNIDAALVKPFNFQNFKDCVYQALAHKVKPNQYWTLIEKGKELLKKGQTDEALRIFIESKTHNPRPCLSNYYIGACYRMKHEFEQSIQVLQEGLKFDPKDFRCLSGLFETYYQKPDYPAAYKTAKLMHETYPVSAHKIVDLVRLSILVKEFDDVFSYYEIFKNIEKRDAALNRGVMAGMLVCAKHFSMKNDLIKAEEILKTVAKLSLDTNLFRFEVLKFFVETKLFRAGEEYFAQLPDEIQELHEVQLLYLELVSGTGTASDVVNYSMKLMKKGVVSPRLYELAIQKSVELKRSAGTIQGLVEEATAKFPDAKSDFDKLLAA